MQDVSTAGNGRALVDEIGQLTCRAAMTDVAAERAQKLVAAGGILAAVAASSCCIVPLLLFSLGVSGAWIGTLTRLAPYQPIFVAVALFCLGYGYWLVRGARRRTACAEDAPCSRALPNRVVAIALIAATFLVTAAVAFDFLAPLILT
jgi:mercuric ion transport protein